jgi:hypothetical protein
MMLISLMMILHMTTQGQDTGTTTNEELAPVTWVGVVPEDYEQVVAENRFGGVEASGGRLLRSTMDGSTLVIEELNNLGNVQAQVILPDMDLGDGRISVHVISTSDGGFLVVSGFVEYEMADGSWASDGGVWSTIVKCNSNGDVEWTYIAENCTEKMLQYTLTCMDGYLFFGEVETPSTKRRGISSPSDIFMMKLNNSGECVETVVVGGSDYDWISSLTQSDELWILYVRAQSTDGDFAIDQHLDTTGTYWQICVDDALNVKGIEPIDRNDEPPYNSRLIGMIDDETIYDTDPRFADFDAGYLELVVDCGDFYLVVSSHNTGEYENTPVYINSIWYYTEAVYSAYDKSNTLLWRAAVDTSPDYDNTAME